MTNREILAWDVVNDYELPREVKRLLVVRVTEAFVNVEKEAERHGRIAEAEMALYHVEQGPGAARRIRERLAQLRAEQERNRE